MILVAVIYDHPLMNYGLLLLRSNSLKKVLSVAVTCTINNCIDLMMTVASENEISTLTHADNLSPMLTSQSNLFAYSVLDPGGYGVTVPKATVGLSFESTFLQIVAHSSRSHCFLSYRSFKNLNHSA